MAKPLLMRNSLSCSAISRPLLEINKLRPCELFCLSVVSHSSLKNQLHIQNNVKKFLSVSTTDHNIAAICKEQTYNYYAVVCVEEYCRRKISYYDALKWKFIRAKS